MSEENTPPDQPEESIEKPLAQLLAENMKKDFEHLEKIEGYIQEVEQKIWERVKFMSLEDLMKFYGLLLSRNEKKQGYFLRMADLGMKSELFKRLMDLDKKEGEAVEEDVIDIAPERKAAREEMKRLIVEAMEEKAAKG